MKKEIKIICEECGYFDRVKYAETKKIEERDLDALSKITREDILNHLRKGIGKMTPRGETKYLDCLCIGNDIELSIQINYQLDCLRDKGYNIRYFDKPEFGVDDSDANYNNPITKEELDYLTIADNRRLDVMFDICGHCFQSGQASISKIVEILNHLGTNREIIDDGLYH